MTWVCLFPATDLSLRGHACSAPRSWVEPPVDCQPLPHNHVSYDYWSNRRFGTIANFKPSIGMDPKFVHPVLPEPFKFPSSSSSIIYIRFELPYCSNGYLHQIWTALLFEWLSTSDLNVENCRNCSNIYHHWTFACLNYVINWLY